MCGIYFSTNRSNHIDKVLEKIAHRGPDSRNYKKLEDWGILGHVRLSIVDLSPEGNQPFQNENGTIHLVCNGEIYNSEDLRNVLIGKGHVFKSHSDNEVILHGYEEWGVSVVDKLLGMFAFAIWDENKQELFAARDHVGIKPLYFKSTSDGLTLASELKAIKDEADTINDLSLAYYLGLGYIPSPLTLYKSCEKLEPGTYLLWSKGKGVRKHTHWTAPTELHEGHGDFETLFHEVIRDHLMADVPIGVFLSAGLDSTAVVTALKTLGYKSEALTIGFPGSPKDESMLALRTAKHLAFPISVSKIESGDVFDLIGKSAAIYDEPQGYSALLTMIQVCELASKKYKVILSGDGGDEVFGGYTWYQDLDFNKKSSCQYDVRSFMYQLTGSSKFLDERYFKSKSTLHRHVWRLFPRFLPEQISRLLSIKFDDEMLLEPLKKHFVSTLPLKRALQRVDLMTFCADSINSKVDGASMAFSLEVRVPFLDKRLIEYGLTLPVNETNDGKSKQRLRTYLKGKVPGAILEQPKQGFSAQMFDSAVFKKMKEQTNAKENLNDAQIWMLYNLNNYKQIF